VYGPKYLPRKLKIAVAVPPSNDVDVFAHDIGFIAIADPADPAALAGFTVTLGGGMGMTHNNAATYPRLGDDFCFAASVEEAVAVAEAIVTTQRDFGDRTNRKHARLKYTVDDRGLDWWRRESREGRVGSCFASRCR
jgi:sulfite reductase (NADPH) hemoprotein beta-component